MKQWSVFQLHGQLGPMFLFYLIQCWKDGLANVDCCLPNFIGRIYDQTMAFWLIRYWQCYLAIVWRFSCWTAPLLWNLEVNSVKLSTEVLVEDPVIHQHCAKPAKEAYIKSFDLETSMLIPCCFAKLIKLWFLCRKRLKRPEMLNKRISWDTLFDFFAEIRAGKNTGYGVWKLIR